MIRPPPKSPLFPSTPLFRSPTTLGIDYRIINGRVYIGGNAVTDPAEIARRTGEFQQRAFYRSEEHTSELQSLAYLVCRLLLEKKKKHKNHVRSARGCCSSLA